MFCGRKTVRAADDFAFPGFGHLNGVRNADGKYQERHQNRQGVYSKADDRQRSEQPQHRHHRNHQRDQCQFQVFDEPPHQHRSDDERDQEKHDDTARAAGNIADRLGKTDDVNGMVRPFVFGAQFIELPG